MGIGRVRSVSRVAGGRSPLHCLNDYTAQIESKPVTRVRSTKTTKSLRTGKSKPTTGYAQVRNIILRSRTHDIALGTSAQLGASHANREVRAMLTY